MTCHRAVAPSPPPLPASKIAYSSQAPAWLLWIPLTSCAASTRPNKTCILGCYYRAWHCLLPCLFFSRGANWGFLSCQPPPLLPAWDQAFPWTEISSCCIATTAAPSCARSSHRIALRFAIQLAGIEARKLSFPHPLSPQATRSVLHPACALVNSSPSLDFLDLSEPGWTVQVHLHTPQTTVDASTATMTTTTPPLVKEAPLLL